MPPIETKPHPPTVEEMKAFAKMFNPIQWAKLCANQDFLNVFTEDLSLARKLAKELL